MSDTIFVKGKKVCLVTGAAGFIGSHLTRSLLNGGNQVIGLDCFTDYYDRKLKEKNIEGLSAHPLFKMIEADIVDIDKLRLEDIGVDLVFHQAAQAGVRASWGSDFAYYTHHNVLGTQRMLEWAKRVKPEKFVYASSSSVYGNTDKLPMHEDDLPKPISPYGVTKLAAEHLCNLYHHNFKVPAISLRYFTVYGPGQRPDMAFNRFIRAVRAGEELVIYGSGEQTRDFTYIDDIVRANYAAATAKGVEGRVYNIGGGSRISINGVLEILRTLLKNEIMVRYEPVQAGDPPHTYADSGRARRELGFKPQTTLEDGLQKMVEWFSGRPN